MRRQAPESSRFAVGARRPGFWIGLWIAVVAAELLALRPVLFDREAPIQWLDVASRWWPARSPRPG